MSAAVPCLLSTKLCTIIKTEDQTMNAKQLYAERKRTGKCLDCGKRNRSKFVQLPPAAKPRRHAGTAESILVDVVLLPVEGGVGLDDDVFVGVLLEFVDEHGLAGLERLGDFRVHAERKVRTFMLGGAGHFARFGLDFVAQRGNGFDHAGAGAVRAGLAKDAFEGLLGALAGDADETEFVEGKRFRGRFVLLEGHL